eukprot:Opistho-2@88819
MASGAMTTLRERQVDALKTMLNLNTPVKKSLAASEPVWKVLVYDRFGQDIISPLLKVGELRELGITLHLLLHSDRDAIPDVPAVYFVMPTAENIARIGRDCRDQLYDSFYLNFISHIPRSMLEELASAAVEADVASLITKVHDQHLNFVSLEPDLFILRNQERDNISFFALNNPEAKDTDIERSVDDIVDSLFSVLVTLGVVPVIRCPRGNAAEMVTEKLDGRLRDHLKNTRNNLFSDGPSGPLSTLQRPLLAIVDRGMDLSPVMHHAWTYQALLHDILDMRLNRVVITQAPGADGKSMKPKTFDLDPADSFWQQNKLSPFPQVATEVENALNAYKVQAEEVTRLSNALGGEDGLAAGAERLNSAVMSLPELTERKRVIDMHTTLATALLDQIKSRQLDAFFETEERLMQKSSLERPVTDMIADTILGTVEDRIRLFAIYMVTADDIPDSVITDCEASLKAQAADLDFLPFLKNLRAFSRMASLPQAGGSGSTGMLSRMANFNKVLETGSEFFKQGVKSLIGKKALPITRIVEGLMDGKGDEYRYLDPKTLRQDSASGRPRATFNEAIVFVVGGGTYVEYQNILDHMKKQQPGKRVTYGSTELLSAYQFVTQLRELGRKSQ